MNSRAQIVATIGPASEKREVLRSMIEHQMDVARINFTWFEVTEYTERINRIRDVARECGRAVLILADLPGPRIQEEHGHTYNASFEFSLTPKDEEMLRFCIEKKIEYIALSFIGSAADVQQYRDALTKLGGTQKLVAKIERKVAVDAIDEIIAASDAIMVARGDLGNEVPLEEIPFIERTLITKANAAGKPVITATQMMLSMTEHPEPTRAEVTDVEEAVRMGSDAVMLSEESAAGHYPVEAVAMMERILVATENHLSSKTFNPL